MFGQDPIKKLIKLMNTQGVESFSVEFCKDCVDGKTHVQSEIKEYSVNCLQDMPLWLAEEIYEAMVFRPSMAVIDRHIGGTMHVKVGK